MSVVKEAMNVEVVNGGGKGPGGPHNGPMRGGGGIAGRGRGGGPRGGVSRFSGGSPSENQNSRPSPNTNRPPPNNTTNRPPPNTSRPPPNNNTTNRPPPNTSRPPPPNTSRPPPRSNVKPEIEKEVKPEMDRGNQGGGNRGSSSHNNSQGGGQGGGNRSGPSHNNMQSSGGNQGANRGGGGGQRFPRRDDGNQQRGRGGQDDRLMEKVSALSGPTYDIPNAEPVERKFSGHCRLYVGNLTNDTTEEELQTLFGPFGETAELFLNKEKNFAFIRLDYRVSAEKAKRELDGSLRKGRQIKVRFAPHTAAIKVKNLTQFVSNELLEAAFSVFGEIERAYVVVDDRGKSQGEGIVEFARKPGAQLALRKCSENCFFLTSSLRPVVVESYENLDDPDGFPEKNMFKKNADYIKAREVGPRFAAPSSFEYDYGSRWKQLYESRKQKVETLERELKMEEEKLEAQMEYARYEHETEMLRDQLRQREADRERTKRDWEMKERQQEEQRRQDEDMMRRQQEEMQLRMLRQEEEMRRRQQENSLFMQAHELTSLMDQQEQVMRQGGGGGGAGIPEARGGGGGGGGGYSPSQRDYDAQMPGDNYNAMRGSGGPGNLPVIRSLIRIPGGFLIRS